MLPADLSGLQQIGHFVQQMDTHAHLFIAFIHKGLSLYKAKPPLLIAL